ncbi:probable 28S ribosomal protein S6, mitochondrial [Portunus trituberculatus]|uniref:probable 28S ribosomal protein S6, mitochondrial n=1 Tax=Portunus trituberculatus TaxID=210409 RepID=UPI001E1CC7DE|nr:probable 28S ribosomal protein S6, mitochondrial [Portunus trituberculatus]
MAKLYELSLIVKHLPKNSTVGVVKRVAESILDEGGFVSKIESLGARELPYRMRAHGQLHSKGSYFLLDFVAPPVKIYDIKDNCKRDVDLIRPMVFSKEEPSTITCTLHEEIKPPAYRSEVQKMVEEAKQRIPINKRRRFKLVTSVGYNPF